MYLGFRVEGSSGGVIVDQVECSAVFWQGGMSMPHPGRLAQCLLVCERKVAVESNVVA